MTDYTPQFVTDYTPQSIVQVEGRGGDGGGWWVVDLFAILRNTRNLASKEERVRKRGIEREEKREEERV